MRIQLLQISTLNPTFMSLAILPTFDFIILFQESQSLPSSKHFWSFIFETNLVSMSAAFSKVSWVVEDLLCLQRGGKVSCLGLKMTVSLWMK
ncbi:hypothetical protein IC582_004449 [Cucumis melo]